jgi:hypothetical protein
MCESAWERSFHVDLKIELRQTAAFEAKCAAGDGVRHIVSEQKLTTIAQANHVFHRVLPNQRSIQWQLTLKSLNGSKPSMAGQRSLAGLPIAKSWSGFR